MEKYFERFIDEVRDFSVGISDEYLIEGMESRSDLTSF